jgi:hypothetical protein
MGSSLSSRALEIIRGISFQELIRAIIIGRMRDS